MRRTIPCILFSITIISLTGNGVAIGADVQRLTYHYIPEKWSLYSISPNPFSPYYMTEFSVPVNSFLSIDLFVYDRESKDRVFVRHLAQPEDGAYIPAVYRLDWGCVCDSLDLPVSDGVYSIIMTAYDDPGRERVVHADTVPVFVFNSGRWVVSEFDSSDFIITTASGWCIRDNRLPQKTERCMASDVQVLGVKSDERDDFTRIERIAIRLANRSSPYREDSSLCCAQGFICAKDTSSSFGYRILRAVSPLYGAKGTTWELSLVEDEILVIGDSYCCPVIVDASRFIDKLRLQGKLK